MKEENCNMSQKSLSYWLKFVIIIMALCALAVHTAASLMLTVSEAEEIDKLRMPWLIFLWASAIPILFAVIISWKTAANIGIGNAFCMQNAKHLKNIAICSAVDAAWVLIGETVLLFLNMNHPGIFLFSMVIVAIGVAISVAAACLSYYIKKAADLREQTELTI
mgnify:FL=1